MIRELYVVGDESRLVVKNILVQLKTTGYALHVIVPEPEFFEFDQSKMTHIVICLFEGMNFEVIRKLAQIQKKGNINLYFIGTINMMVDEESYFNKIPSTRFPSYTVNIEQLMSVMEKNDLEKKRVLVVDDEPILLRSIKTWLGDDFEVSLVNSGEAALQFLDMHPVDLVLLDYKMPTMDGPEVLKRIRMDDNLEKLPVMFLTAKNDRESVMTVMSLKPEGYILKSKSPAEIKQAVLDFFKNRIQVFES